MGLIWRGRGRGCDCERVIWEYKFDDDHSSWKTAMGFLDMGYGDGE